MPKFTSYEMPHPRIATRLTLDAARFMREQALVIRNTNTEKLSSLHYQGHHKWDWHGVRGIYSVPLWTIAISGITQEQQSSDDIAAKVNRHKSQQLKLVPQRPSIMFVWFLQLNKHHLKQNGETKINDNALVAIALLVAQSDPNQKNTMIKLIINLIEDE